MIDDIYDYLKMTQLHHDQFKWFNKGELHESFVQFTHQRATMKLIGELKEFKLVGREKSLVMRQLYEHVTECPSDAFYWAKGKMGYVYTNNDPQKDGLLVYSWLFPPK
jgi:hypothetical protein